MTTGTNLPAEIYVQHGVARPYGHNTNKTLTGDALLRTIRRVESRKLDVIARRAAIRADLDSRDRFSFHIDNETFIPTSTAVRQIAEQARIPTEFLRSNIDKYPTLARDMVNRWLLDPSAANRNRKKVVNPEGIKHLVRLLRPYADQDTGEVPGMVRALLSSRYMIIDNSDVAGTVLDTVSKTGTAIQISGSMNDETMYLRVKMLDISATINFPGKGQGHDRIHVPCGASLLLSGSDVGAGRVIVSPELEIFTCSNLLRATESLAQIHMGKEYEDMGVLSASTIRDLNMATLGRIRDITAGLLTVNNFQRVADTFSEFAGQPVTDAVTVVENVTEKFSLPSDMGKSILDRFIQEEMGNRFGLAQAITFQAHAVREDDFETATLLENVGSTILRMSPKTFEKELVQA